MSGKAIRKEYVLEGLHCANCALKIEKGVKELEGVENCSLNFANKKLVVETSKNDLIKIEEQTKNLVKILEPDVQVRSLDESHDNKGSQWLTWKNGKVLLGALLFATAFFLQETLSEIFFIVSYLFVGGDVVMKAVRNMFKKQFFDEYFLMTIATLGAFAIGEHPEAVAVMLFYQVGELFQSYAVNQSRKSIASLMDIRPHRARVRTEKGVIEKKPEGVKVGEVLIVKPGERIPLDGIVIEGVSSADTSALTGESLPRDIEKNDEVLSGFINLNGLLEVKVTKVYEESTVAKILELVEHASSKKAPTENFITTFARYYTPAVVAIAALLAVLPPIIIGGEWSEWIYRALIFLVISCPCALVVSIPLGFFGGIGRSSREGILVKGGNYLEALNHVKTIVFDKTGTLTKGHFQVKAIIVENGTQEQLLQYAAIGESNSNHPIAQSILRAYGKVLNLENIQYEEVAGYGIKAVHNGEEILVGNEKWLKKNDIQFSSVQEIGTIVYVSVNGIYQGAILIGDEIKEDSKETIHQLKLLGIKETVMLTGDHDTVAKNVGEELGVDRIYSNLLPGDKVTIFEELATKTGKTIFVGDGLNDTPVLARADIGIAMGGLGSQAAIEAADVVIMNDEPSKIVTAIKIARYTRKIVWQNIAFAFGVKFLVLALGTIGLATMWEAVFADVGVTLIAVLNAMRILKKKSF